MFENSLSLERSTTSSFSLLRVLRWEVEELPITLLAPLVSLGHIFQHFFFKISERQQQQVIGVIQDIYGTTQIGVENVSSAFQDYYRNLLGPSMPVTPLDKTYVKTGAIVSAEGHAMLTRNFTKEEIKQIVFSTDSNSSPCIDGFSAGFFKSPWNIIEKDFCIAVQNFLRSGHMSKQANSTLITLIPKKQVPSSVIDFRPISYYDLMIYIRGDVPSVKALHTALLDFANISWITLDMFHSLITKVHNAVQHWSSKLLSYAGKRKHVFKKWQQICSPWASGGFNIKNIAIWNHFLLVKWLWVLSSADSNLLAKWVKAYIFKDKDIWSILVKDHYVSRLKGILTLRDLLTDQT
ncbi:uncharacterized protein LOC141601430 [Silene latifolia]|uniref:uncharacterized protein LOC141601430 n=1 Tax=Silene latifolia TaxID=37657 RepID=UPI003D7721EF